MTGKTALVTGASVGIGKAFALYHAAQGGDVIIVARRADALALVKQEIEQKHKVTVHAITEDVGTPEGATRLYNTIKSKGLKVDYLINNAGMGYHGLFHEADLAKNLAMVDLNIKSLMTLTHHVVKDMIARRDGKILHVGSTAGMIPGPFQATYHATKAFVNSFSLALAEELKDTGVTSSVLTPGAVATEFFERADMTGAKGLKGPIPGPESVAKIGYDGMMAGKLVIHNDKKLKFMLNWLVPFLPYRQTLKMARDFGEKG
jgi:uncharacterized protein